MIRDPFDGATCKDAKRCVSQGRSAALRVIARALRTESSEDLDLARRALTSLESDPSNKILNTDSKSQVRSADLSMLQLNPEN